MKLLLTLSTLLLISCGHDTQVTYVYVDTHTTANLDDESPLELPTLIQVTVDIPEAQHALNDHAEGRITHDGLCSELKHIYKQHKHERD